MNKVNTKAIVLTRINYGEADRIVTLLTPENGKLRLMARGVRKEKSKLAGGIEIFCVNDISFVRGKSEIGTLISSRMDSAYTNIVKDIDKVQLGYDLIKLINKVTEDHPEESYYLLLSRLYMALDEAIDLNLIDLWFKAQLLRLAGHSPNLYSDHCDNKLVAEDKYSFDINQMHFNKDSRGVYDSKRIKTLRLLFSDHSPLEISSVEDIEPIVKSLTPLINSMMRVHLNVKLS